MSGRLSVQSFVRAPTHDQVCAVRCGFEIFFFFFFFARSRNEPFLAAYLMVCLGCLGDGDFSFVASSPASSN